MADDNVDPPLLEPPVEVPDQPHMGPLEGVPPAMHPLVSMESKLLESTWLAIGAFNDYVMITGNIRVGRDLWIDSSKWGVPLEDLNEEINRRIDLVHSVHGPFRNHIDEIFDLFDEYRGQLELMRSNLIEAAREVEAGTRPIIHELEPGYRGPRHGVESLCAMIDHSFDSLRDRIGYESQRRV